MGAWKDEGRSLGHLDQTHTSPPPLPSAFLSAPHSGLEGASSSELMGDPLPRMVLGGCGDLGETFLL